MPKRPPAFRPTGEPPPRPTDRRAQLLLGATAALVVALVGDAVLLPHVDRSPARVWGPAVAAAWLSLGWWASAFRPWTRPALLGAGAALALAGGLVAASLPALHAGLLADLLAADLPYHALIVLRLSLAAAPLAFPLGLLVGAALTGPAPERAPVGGPAPDATGAPGDRRGLGVLLLGASLGLCAAPWLAEVLLGHGATLRAAALLAAATTPLIGTGPSTCPRLARGVAPTLLAVGCSTLLAHRLLVPIVDLGTNSAPWYGALACLGAAVGCLLPRVPRPSPLDALIALALPLVLAAEPVVRSLRAPALDPLLLARLGLAPDALEALPNLPLLVDLVRLSALALPLGWLVGRLLADGGNGTPLAALGLLLTAALPAALLLLPRLGVHGLLLVAALPVTVVSLRGPTRPGLVRWLVTLALVGGLSLLPMPDGPGGRAPERTWQLADGLAAQVIDPDTLAPRMAVDGRVPLGRHPLQAHRMVHLPFLWQGGAGRTLIVATDLGECEQAAREHEPSALDWLRPFPVPTISELDPRPPTERRPQGNERMFLLAGQHAPAYDLIVLAPDPRVRQRAGQLATVEFYAEAAARLTDDGLLCQWWDLATIDVGDLKAAIASAAAVFPATYVAGDHPRSRRGLLAIVGCQQPLALDLAALADTLASWPPVAGELATVGLDALGLAALVDQHEGLLELLVPTEERLSDARSTLGARGGLRALAQPHTLFTNLDTFARRRCDPSAWIVASEQDERRLQSRTRDVLLGWQHLLGAAQEVVLAEGAEVPAFEREAPGQGPELEGSAFLEALVPLPDWRYLQDHVVGFAARLAAEGRAAEAEQYLRQAVAHDASSPRLRFELAGLVEQRGDREDARTLYGTVLAFAPRHQGALQALERLREP